MPCTLRRPGRPRAHGVPGSDQAVPRHPAISAERCFLPDLTRFTRRRCAGPDPQRRAPRRLRERRPRVGIQPCWSGLQVQGTASSPPSTARLMIAGDAYPAVHSEEHTMDQRITLITVGVADLERSLRFYRDGLGWTPSSASMDGSSSPSSSCTGGSCSRCGRDTCWPEDARVADGGGWGGDHAGPEPRHAGGRRRGLCPGPRGRRRLRSSHSRRRTGAGTRATWRIRTGIRGSSRTTRSGRWWRRR